MIGSGPLRPKGGVRNPLDLSTPAPRRITECRRDRVPPWRGCPASSLLSAFWGSSFALIKIALDAGVRAALGRARPVRARCGDASGDLPADPQPAAARPRHVGARRRRRRARSTPCRSCCWPTASSTSTRCWPACSTQTTPLMTLLFVPAAAADRTDHGAPGRRPADRVRRCAVRARGVAGDRRSARSRGRSPVLAPPPVTAHASPGHAALLRRPHRLSGCALGRAAALCQRSSSPSCAPVLAASPAWPGVPAAVALLALGALGTGFAYVLNLGVVRAAGPTVASTVTYVIPIWSTAIGAVLLAEPVGLEHRRRRCPRRGRRRRDPRLRRNAREVTSRSDLLRRGYPR